MSVAYCDSCGRVMFVFERFTYTENKCGCGNNYTSHDTNFSKRETAGRFKHYQELSEALDRAQRGLVQATTQGLNTDHFTKEIDQAKVNIKSFRKAEERRIRVLYNLLPVGLEVSLRDFAEGDSPFGASLFPDD